MRKILSCEFNPDTACVENEVANSMYQRSELDWLTYNDPLAYAKLILNGDPIRYLKVVADRRWSESDFE